MNTSIYMFKILFKVLQEAYSRCVGILNQSTTPNDLPVQICSHVTRCYTVAAQFEGCQEKITELPSIVKDMCKILNYKVI